MWVLFMWWGDGSVTQTEFSSEELALAGERQLAQHRAAVGSMLIQTHAPRPTVELETVDTPLGPVTMPVTEGGRRGRKG